MTALETVTEELARVRAELEDLPEDAFSRRAELRARQQELRATAAELRRIDEEQQRLFDDDDEDHAQIGLPIDLRDPTTIDIRDARDEVERKVHEQQKQTTV